MGDREVLDNQNSQAEKKSTENGLDVSEASEDSAVDTQDKLINFDDPINKLDHMTLDDLNDDDFDPRALDNVDNTSDSSESTDDFNPRGALPAFTVSATPPVHAPPTAHAPNTAPAKILPPPSIPARDPAKISGAPVMSNPFTSTGSNDAFGMSSFAAGNNGQLLKVTFPFIKKIISTFLFFRIPLHPMHLDRPVSL